MGVQYKTTIPWDLTLVDLEFISSQSSTPTALQELVWKAVKTTTGAPTATADKFIPGAIIQNAIDGTVYINEGSTASPSWALIESGTIALASAQVLVGNAGGVATAVALSGDVTNDNAGVTTVDEISGKVIQNGRTTSAGAGAVAVTGSVHEVETTATGDALTLVDGTVGQILDIIYTTEAAGGDTAILTPTTLAGGTTITFNALGDTARLRWSAVGGWYVLGLGGTAAVA